MGRVARAERRAGAAQRGSWCPLALVLGAAVAGCTGDDDDPGPARPVVDRGGPKVNLTFGVWGTKNEIDAYQGVVDTYNATNDEARSRSSPTPPTTT